MAQETATLVAAAIAAVAAVTAAVISGLSARANRHVNQQARGREHWWTRFSWAMEKAVSNDPKEVAIGLATIGELLDAEWVTPEDNMMAAGLASTIVSMAGGGDDR